MFKIDDSSVKGLTQFENMLGALGQEGQYAAGRALARTGDMARTQVVRELARQTGLPQKTIRKSIKVKRPNFGPKVKPGNQDLSYTMTAAGGDVSLKYFKHRETRKGVVAHLGAERGNVLFERTFFRGGAFPNRVDLEGFGGHVMDRVSEQRLDLRKVKSGVIIPQDMAEKATTDALDESVQKNLPRRLSHELNRLLD